MTKEEFFDFMKTVRVGDAIWDIELGSKLYFDGKFTFQDNGIHVDINYISTNLDKYNFVIEPRRIERSFSCSHECISHLFRNFSDHYRTETMLSVLASNVLSKATPVNVKITIEEI